MSLSSFLIYIVGVGLVANNQVQRSVIVENVLWEEGFAEGHKECPWDVFGGLDHHPHVVVLSGLRPSCGLLQQVMMLIEVGEGELEIIYVSDLELVAPVVVFIHEIVRETHLQVKLVRSVLEFLLFLLHMDLILFDRGVLLRLVDGAEDNGAECLEGVSRLQGHAFILLDLGEVSLLLEIYESDHHEVIVPIKIEVYLLVLDDGSLLVRP